MVSSVGLFDLYAVRFEPIDPSCATVTRPIRTEGRKEQRPWSGPMRLTLMVSSVGLSDLHVYRLEAIDPSSTTATRRVALVLAILNLWVPRP